MSHPELQRVVYVDNEPHIRALAQISLEKVGKLTTCICGSGKEAMATVPAFRPDLILLDVMMPEMDGPRTLAALRATPELAHVPVVFVTAKTAPTEVERLLGLGAAEVISKPFAPLELPAHLQAIWSRSATGRA